MIVTDQNRDEVVNISQRLPSLMFLYSHHCPHCVKTYPEWSAFAQLYINDTGVLLAECDFVNSAPTCKTLANVTGYPTFVAVLHGRLLYVNPIRDVTHFSELIENLRSFDPTLKCTRDFGQSDDYPIFAVSFPDEDPVACDKLLSITETIPQADGHLQLARRSNGSLSVAVRISRSFQTNFTVVDNFNILLAWVTDYLHQSFTNWSLSEMDLITLRRVGLFISNETLQVAKAIMLRTALKEYCFGILNVADFIRQFPDVDLHENELPAFAILNKQRTKYKLVKSVKFKAGFRELLDLVNITDEAEFDIPFEMKRLEASHSEPAPRTGTRPGPVEANSWLGVAFLMTVGVAISILYVRWSKRKLKLPPMWLRKLIPCFRVGLFRSKRHMDLNAKLLLA
jgi:hypothetical protein